MLRAGDGRLTSEQSYIFTGVLEMFGRDMEDNFLSLLTFHDGGEPKVLAALREANIHFQTNIAVNNSGIFQPKESAPVDSKFLLKFPEAVKYQDFFKSAKQVFDMLQSSKSKDLELTLEVLDLRDKLREDLIILRELQDDMCVMRNEEEKMKDEADAFKKQAEDNEVWEVDVGKEVREKVAVEVGKFVSNCLTCNQTCCYPCQAKEMLREIKNDYIFKRSFTNSKILLILCFKASR